MKVLFIHCNINTGNGRHFIPGVASISAVLKQAGHKTALLFLQEETDRNTLLKRVEEESPDLIGFTTLTNQWPYIRQYTGWIKDKFDLPMIHGGIHATVASDEILAHDEVDLICVGEGEFPMKELAERLEQGKSYDDIPNLWIKKRKGHILKNPLRPLIQDLDALPFPDREICNYRQLLLENPFEATLLMAGRGCPFKCTYCVNNAFHNLYRDLGKYVRLRTPERVLEEIYFLKQTYGIKDLFIYDDTFTYNHNWLKHFCDLYRKEIGLPFAANLRVDTVNDHILKMLKEAGCYLIVAGIESGSERIRREVMGRKITNEQIIHVFKKADELGLKTWTNNMIGLPSETPEEAEETIQLNRVIRPNHAQIFVFYPFPGTALYDVCKREGYFSTREKTSIFDGDSILDLPTLTNEQILDYTNKFKQMACQVKLEKEQRGDFDFFFKFPEAKVGTEGNDYVKSTTAIINGEERLVIFAHPESKITYTLDLFENAQLFFGIGLSPLVWSEGKGGGVDFEVALSDNGSERLLFSRYIDPKNNVQDRKWHDIELDLSNLHPGQKQLHFITTTRGRDRQYCWALWSHPFLIKGGIQADRVCGRKRSNLWVKGLLRRFAPRNDILEGSRSSELMETWAGKERRLPQRFEPAYVTLKRVADFLQGTAGSLPLSLRSRILDVGCGEKPYFPFFASNTRNYFGVDIQPGPQVDAIFDGSELPFPNETFDLVVSTQVLEHTRDPHGLMNEMHRVLKKDGRIIVSAPFVWEIHNYPADYWRFSEQGLKELMKHFREVTIENCGNSAQCLLQTFNLFIDRTVSWLWFKRRLFKTVNLLSERLASRSSDRLLPANYLVTGRK